MLYRGVRKKYRWPPPPCLPQPVKPHPSSTHFFTFPYKNQARLFTALLDVTTSTSNMCIAFTVTACRWNSRQALSSPPSTEILSAASGLHHDSHKYQSLTMETQVQSQASPCWIGSGQTGQGARFSPSTSVFPCQYYSTNSPIYSFIYH